uniref:Uncharacterized protein n=1 Tax=Siphoviridae sp. ctP6p7 TaxID=2826319 RepID=A0A8S5M2U9_9CAUD|nr:MAG TPA: hypothetical protein [Siphoviridae sp. ctP6p7]DAN73856.1 MAG TPA: hypothetical protein [Caudoviricetes sp.]
MCYNCKRIMQYINHGFIILDSIFLNLTVDDHSLTC